MWGCFAQKVFLFAAFTPNLLNSESSSKAPTELLLPRYLQFVAGVSEPLTGIRAWQNKRKMSALSHPLKKSALGLKKRGHSKRKKKEDAPSL